jgi:hypothetical protein
VWHALASELQATAEKSRHSSVAHPAMFVRHPSSDIISHPSSLVGGMKPLHSSEAVRPAQCSWHQLIRMEQGRWFDAIEVPHCLSACDLMTDSCILLSSAHDLCGIEGCCDVQAGVQDTEQNCVFRGFPSRHAPPTGQVQVSWSHTHAHCGHKHPVCCCARTVSSRTPASIRHQVNMATVHSQRSL